MVFALKILIVDDEKGMRDFLSFELGSRGYSVSVAATGAEALSLLAATEFQLVISDIKMPGISGLELMEVTKKSFPDVEFIISTGYATIDAAVEAMKKGAYDFIEKPFNIAALLALLVKVSEKIEYSKKLAVYEEGGEIFSKIKLEELLPELAGISLRLFRADDVCIMLPAKGTGFYVAGSAGCASEEERLALAVLAWKAFGAGSAEAKPLVLDSKPAEISGARGIQAPEKVKSLLLLPLPANGGAVSLVRLSESASVYGAADVFQARLFSAQVARALNNARLYGELVSALGALKETQAQLLQSEKMASIGKLTAGVAHEINNPLAGVIGYAELLLNSGALAPQQREDASLILEQGRRCREIVRGMLQFSRKKDFEKASVPLKILLDECLHLCAHALRKGKLEVTLDFPAALPPASGDRPQLQQVFLSIIDNAIFAIKDQSGGQLRITASFGGETITIRFEDNGSGIPAENISKIFDPFFTTRHPGEGTGLGLSVAYGIIQNHSGRIYAQNAKVKGAVIIVELPLWKEKQP